MKLCLLAILVALLGCSTATDTEQVQEQSTKPGENPWVVINGSDSLLQQKSYLRITTKKDLAVVWQRHKGQSTTEPFDFYYNPLGMPTIDFETSMVVAIFDGRGWNNAGIDARRVFIRNDDLVVRYQDKSFQTAGIDGGGQLGAAYGFFILPRSNRKLVIEEDDQTMGDGGPKWKIVAQLPKL
ncbi:MAG: hypothetical protein ACI97A_000536 [Planctomycetota bacterium]|jgi:hypothetical protein